MHRTDVEMSCTFTPNAANEANYRAHSSAWTGKAVRDHHTRWPSLPVTFKLTWRDRFDRWLEKFCGF